MSTTQIATILIALPTGSIFYDVVVKRDNPFRVLDAIALLALLAAAAVLILGGAP